MSSDRLTGLDASFLHLEDASSHMHVAGVMIFEGSPPPYDELLEAIERRLGLVPRYRQRLAFVPLGQGRPKWVDDPHLNLRYHVRSTALPAPGSEQQLKELAGPRLRPAARPRQAALGDLARRGPRGRPLRDAVEDPPRARGRHLRRGHHVGAVRHLARARRAHRHRRALAAAPAPLPAQLLGEALVERATIPTEIARSVRAVFRGPRLVAEGACATPPWASARWPGPASTPRPPRPYNKSIGPHRRFTWVRANLADIKAIKNELGGTVNDVVLATVAGALGKHLRRRGQNTDGLELKAMVPVSVRADVERGALGNRVAAMMAPLPVWCQDPWRASTSSARS